MKKRRSMSTEYAQAESLAVRTGEHCPETGWWHPVQPDQLHTAAAARYIGEGSVMPALAGAPAVWTPRKN